jgi:hypothetical protein
VPKLNLKIATDIRDSKLENGPSFKVMPKTTLACNQPESSRSSAFGSTLREEKPKKIKRASILQKLEAKRLQSKFKIV